MTRIADQDQVKSAVERDIYDETPVEVLELFQELGLNDDAERAELSRLSNLPPSEDNVGIQWVRTHIA